MAVDRIQCAVKNQEWLTRSAKKYLYKKRSNKINNEKNDATSNESERRTRKHCTHDRPSDALVNGVHPATLMAVKDADDADDDANDDAVV